MNSIVRRGLALLLVVGLGLTVAGCGGKRKVRGKVVQNGQPMQLSEKGVFVISFIAASDTAGKNPEPTKPNNDGTFEVVGRDGKGIAPGKYKVAVEACDPYPGNDKLGGKFTPAKTTLQVDVGKGEVIVDVGK
jgi:hypothetical protein